MDASTLCPLISFFWKGSAWYDFYPALACVKIHIEERGAVQRAGSVYNRYKSLSISPGVENSNHAVCWESSVTEILGGEVNYSIVLIF